MDKMIPALWDCSMNIAHEMNPPGTVLNLMPISDPRGKEIASSENSTGAASIHDRAALRWLFGRLAEEHFIYVQMFQSLRSILWVDLFSRQQN